MMIRLNVKKRPDCLLWLVLLLVFAFCSSVYPRGSYALTAEEENTIAIYEKTAPSIVNITTQACEPEFFFCAVPTSASGSGIILKPDGTIVTNYHVIENAASIEVALDDGHRYKASVIGKSKEDDVAIIKIDAGKRPLKTISLGDPAKVKVGEKVLAIGNPFGLGQTLTVGTVSMVGRDIKTDSIFLRDLIQTDAPINPGNSGGALVNSGGELVGMSTIILSPTGSSIGIGFAIPASRIAEVVPGIINPWQRRITWILILFVSIWAVRRIYESSK